MKKKPFNIGNKEIVCGNVGDSEVYLLYVIIYIIISLILLL